MNSELAVLLVCPICRHDLAATKARLICQNCNRAFALQNDIPVFLPEPAQVISVEHQSNSLGAEYEAILQRGDELILNIGAGATAVHYPNCVEFEHKIFRHTDVVGDAHALPFRDATFDRVFAFNVFEHLSDPVTAASEIHRVLKPGGALALHTAFLQALHEAPHHYYNATEYGVRQWFRAFEIEKCEVSGNFSPGVMLGFLCATLLETLRESEMSPALQSQIAQTDLKQWADFWIRGIEPPGFTELLALPQSLQKRVSAGFELLARKAAGAS